MKMSVTRILKELQLGPNKIMKKIEGLVPVCIRRKGVIPAGYAKAEEFDKAAVSDFTSIVDLIERQAKLKAAVAVSNATTKVTIKNKTMTVTEAIALRNETAKHKMALLAKLMRANSDAENQTIRLQEANKTQFDALVQGTFGKASNPSKESVESLKMTFESQNDIVRQDPLDLKVKIATLTEELSDIEKEIDLTLSEVNAVTELDV